MVEWLGSWFFFVADGTEEIDLVIGTVSRMQRSKRSNKHNNEERGV